MDKSEYNLKIEELKTAMHAHDFEKAVDVADSLDIKKIRDNNLLSLIADAYELTGDNEQAKKILLMAYENTNTGRQLAYRLCLISIKLKELDEANEFYQDFIEMAPRDSARFILKYKMAKAKKKPVEELIKITLTLTWKKSGLMNLQNYMMLQARARNVSICATK